MKNTGFAEITEERLNYCGVDPWFYEIALTGRCNFSCTYCNRFSGDVDIESLSSHFATFDRCKHIQVTGGEPTLHKDFYEIMALCKTKAARVGLSTNGTFGVENYLCSGADMFSLSLDDYDNAILLQRGYKQPELVVETITELAKSKYVNAGLVVDALNVARIESIVDYILSLGVADIKISTVGGVKPVFSKGYSEYPILSYRVANFNEDRAMRGWPANQCALAVNDVTIAGDSHYPCLVYFREGGKAIGKLSENVKEQRELWAKHHNPQLEAICSKYCMDFKCEFNHAATLSR